MHIAMHSCKKFVQISFGIFGSNSRSLIRKVISSDYEKAESGEQKVSPSFVSLALRVIRKEMRPGDVEGVWKRFEVELDDGS